MLPILGLGLAVGPSRSSWPSTDPCVRPDEIDPLDLGGSGKRLLDLAGEAGFGELPSSVLDNFRIALGRRRGGVAAAGNMTGEGCVRGWFVGPEDIVDALGRARPMNDRSLRISLAAGNWAEFVVA